MYEEPPFSQREKLHSDQRERLRQNSSFEAGQQMVLRTGHEDDMPMFSALCRGEELRVRNCFKLFFPSYTERLKNCLII